MATCTLTLYKNTKLDTSKNDIIDDIEVYLAGKTSLSVDSNFQYQRFELDKTIKVDLPQDYQTKAININKYDYCKLTTTVGTENSETVVYYYFITKASQIAQKTIELTLKMDTLNTFKFTRGAFSNDSYTLSPKTVVSREHKNRLAVSGTWEHYYRSAATDNQSLAIDRWTQSLQVLISPRTLKFEFDYLGWSNYWKALDPKPVGLTWPITITPNDDFISVYQYNVLGNMTQILNASMSKIEIYTDKIVYTSILDEQYIQNFPSSIVPFKGFDLVFGVSFCNPVTGTPTSFTSTTPDLWEDYVKQFVVNSYVYNETTDVSYVRKIDDYSENIRADLFKAYDSGPLNNYMSGDITHPYLDWYLVYTTDPDDPTAGAKVQLYSEQGYTVYQRSTDINITLTPQLEEIPEWQNEPEVVSSEKTTYHGEATYLTGAYFEIAGDRYAAADYYFHAVRQYNSDTKFAGVQVLNRSTEDVVRGYSNVSAITLHNFVYIWVYGTHTWHNQNTSTTYIQVATPGSLTVGTSDPWDSQTLTNQKFIKAFAFPYPVINSLNTYTESAAGQPYILRPANCSWNSTDNCLEFNKAQAGDFSYQLKLLANPFSVFNISKTELTKPAAKQLRNIEYESKLYHSDYYQPKFVYDSFSFPFSLELMDENEQITVYNGIARRLATLPVTYVVSKNIQSKFAFIFDNYTLKKSYQDYDNVLTIERNNEKALYTNAYLNYIKSGGYTYDQKKIKDQNVTNGITSGVTLAASIATLAGGIAATASGVGSPLGVGAIIGGVSGLVGAGAGIVKNIINAQDQDAALAQKINQLQNQATNVSGNEDIDILQAICENKPKLVRYELSERMKNAMWDLFHYCGYATNEQKVPHTDTRLYFNFIQADIVFDEYNFNEDIAEDIKNRWKQGVTFFHKVKDSNNTYYYDIDQIYENFEVSIL